MAVAYPLSVEVRRTEEWGRGLYAKSRIRLGTEVLSSEPYAHVLSNSERGSCCDYCLQRAENLRRCSRCKYVRYCGRGCQQRDWGGHQAECRGIAAVHPNTPTDTMRLVVRILQRKRTGHQSPGDWEMDLLCSHKGVLSEEVEEELALQVVGIQKLTEGQEGFHGETVYDVLCKVLCNTFTICDEHLNCIGAAIYIGPSALNHSCAPNCVVTHRGHILHLRAIRDIQPGEQLLISYVDLMDTAKRRQAHLKRVYSFECACTRCQEEEKLKEGSVYSAMYGTKGEVSVAQRDTVMDKGFQKLEELERMRKTKDWPRVVTACQDLLTQQACVLQTANIVTAKTMECCLLASIELEQWPKALLMAEKLACPYRHYLPENHPVLATHLVRLGKLYRLSGTTEHLEHSIRDLSKETLTLKNCSEIAIPLFCSAVELLSVCCGSDHPTTHQAVEMLQDSQRELVHRKMSKPQPQT